MIPPAELTDQHLIAEHNEILMLCGCLTKTLNSKVGFQQKKVPQEFTLGKGHIYFFFDKGHYLHRRFGDVAAEMILRGFSPKKDFPAALWPAHLYNDYISTQEGMDLVRERIALRISQKPGWYRYRGRKIEDQSEADQALETISLPVRDES